MSIPAHPPPSGTLEQEPSAGGAERLGWGMWRSLGIQQTPNTIVSARPRQSHAAGVGDLALRPAIPPHVGLVADGGQLCCKISLPWRQSFCTLQR